MPDNEPKKGVLEGLVQNNLLTAVGRIAMGLSIPILSGIGGYIWGMEKSIEEIKSELIPSIERRVVSLEHDNNVIGTTINRVEGKIDIVDDRTITMLQAIARLEATKASSLAIGTGVEGLPSSIRP